ncbi:phosphoribosyltransferase domain-containing protein [Deinococcus sp.]|uniref:phosphoribosyltransferase domain-containing protein n=1 Tax=Deinococcus sp. TaxID=47478 RepID=UPI0025BA79ED|nr:phosphoribosyltransferase domain-containing protein [Deinococcus sp.]
MAVSEADSRTVLLPSGTLTLKIDRSALPLDDLLDYAVRRNPRRGFLFVSKVLGKHIPVTPHTAKQVWTLLAAALPPLTQPHFIGLAETATALGEGVFQTWLEQTGRQATFQHTTRYLTRRPLLLRFDEPHSHAPAHLLYDPGEQARVARELVLVDDEISTGTTLQNLAVAWLELHPQVKRVVLVSLTDWCGRRGELAAALGVPVDFVSVLRGSFSFTTAPDWQPPQLPAVVGNGEDKTELLPTLSPRYGDVAGTSLPHLTFSHTDRVLVLGMGEFQYPAYALAAALAPSVARCHWSATTRSPILPGLAMGRTLTFSDSVDDGIPNYLYNVSPADYDHILLTYEGRCEPDPELLRELGPHARAVKLA